MSIACLLPFLVGCQKQRGPDYSVLKMSQVTGTVTLDGQPVSGARVEFVEAEKQPPRVCAGETDESGEYTIFRDRNVPGCLPGEMLVKITGESGVDDDSSGGDPLRIPAKYNRKTELRRTVEQNSRHTFDFALESK
ncbi:carboxypeptidase-like regulatory domain-containing protein [Posidoniimonas polymericola]|uniref:carboxypeptidase-like regulatory domain-containing protein n=1 Tax=Posidoniimonas polymericola TaxID=2528002 RepID=UPI0011B5E508|nr:carboxypeptidase-like regulatory domain-containing protein [Posidoniimonas polymericola]